MGALSFFLGLLKSPGALLQAILGILQVYKEIKRLFQKSPTDEMAKDQKKHDDAAKNAEEKDNTDGLFGGSK